jgi:hypothetical protein
MYAINLTGGNTDDLGYDTIGNGRFPFCRICLVDDYRR